MDSTVLKISNATNTLFDDYQIGNILNKNLLIRNIALMRNIGKYSMYNQLMFPEVGMVYNVYEHTLCRPKDIGAINGVIGYNHALDDDAVLGNRGETVSDRFFNQPYTPNSKALRDKKTKGESKSNDGKSDSNLDNRDATLKKIIYTTNSNSIERSGGDYALGEVMKVVNQIFVTERQYVPDDVYSLGNGDNKFDSFNGMSVNRPKILPTYTKLFGHARLGNGRDTDDRYVKTYAEGQYFWSYGANEEQNQNIPDHLTVEYMGDEEDHSAHIKSGKPATGRLLQKTNKLFHDGMINSLISRFYAKEMDDDSDGYGNPIYLSRGRNLRKAGAAGIHDIDGGGYDNPYCRVWTIHNQYNRMTDLIRPRMDDETGGFATLERIQAVYGDGIRPANGASRLSDMSVLKPNGFVNIAPHQNDSGELDIESIKKCMFSIENLAWKDVKLSSSTTRNNGSDDLLTIGGTLSPEQIGPNGGRIMWFPPYNLRFSEDVSTRWNANTFIGRGEDIYSYINTERGGTLSFTLLIDHPSIINKWRGANPNTNSMENEEKILRFFAGCDELGEESAEQMQGAERVSDRQDKGPSTEQKEVEELRVLKAFVFFPNNYSGYDDDSEDFSKFLYTGNADGVTSNIPYEKTTSGSRITPAITGEGQIWYYKVDDELVPEKLVRFEKNGHYYIRTNSGAVKEQTNSSIGNNHDTDGFMLNAFNDGALDSRNVRQKMTSAGFITTDDKYGKTFYSYKDLYEVVNGQTANTELSILLNTNEIENIRRVEYHGYASSHGHENNNQSLCWRRADSVRSWLISKKPSLGTGNKNDEISTHTVVQLDATNHNVSSLDAKLARSVEVIFYVGQSKDPKKSVQATDNSRVDKATQARKATRTVNKENQQQQLNALKQSQRVMYQSVMTPGKERLMYDNEYTYFKDLSESDSFIKSRIIEKINYFDPAYHSITPEGFNARLTFLHQCTRQGPTSSAADGFAPTKDTGVGNLAFGRAPYCVLRIGDFYNTKILIDSLTINYDTSNGVQWDLNPEGAGVQPMMAEVNIRFKFIGGADISGPIERLQNAVSFNYYSNASIYDRRADYRQAFIDHENGFAGSGGNPVYRWDSKTQGRQTEKKE